MGWGSGSEILQDVWGTVKEHIPPSQEVEVLGKLCDIFWDHDCDTLDDLISTYPEAEKALHNIGYMDEDE